MMSRKPGYYWVWHPPRWGFHGEQVDQSSVHLEEWNGDGWLIFGDERWTSDAEYAERGLVVLGTMNERWTGAVPPDHGRPEPPGPFPAYEPRESLEDVPVLAGSPYRNG